MKNELNINFPSKLINVQISRAILIGFLSELDLPMSVINELKTALSEAVTNAIVHAYQNKDGIVKIKCLIEEENIEIEVSDTGEGIENVEEARKPLYTTRSNLERAGMGFTIMENFMDTLKIESIVGLGTKVTMTKKLRKEIN